MQISNFINFEFNGKTAQLDAHKIISDYPVERSLFDTYFLFDEPDFLLEVWNQLEQSQVFDAQELEDLANLGDQKFKQLL